MVKKCIFLNTKALKQAVGAGKLVTKVADPLSKTLGPDVLESRNFSYFRKPTGGICLRRCEATIRVQASPPNSDTLTFSAKPESHKRDKAKSLIALNQVRTGCAAK